MGVASHFHNYPGEREEREEGAVRTGLNPSSAPYSASLFLSCCFPIFSAGEPKTHGGIVLSLPSSAWGACCSLWPHLLQSHLKVPTAGSARRDIQTQLRSKDSAGRGPMP